MKKILAIVLAVVMLLPVFAVNVFAAGDAFNLTATCDKAELGENGAKLTGWCPALLVPWKNGDACAAFKTALAKEDAVIEVVTDKKFNGLTFQANEGNYQLVTLSDKLSEVTADGKVTTTFSAKAYTDLVANTKYDSIPDKFMSFDNWNATGIDTPWVGDGFADVLCYSFRVYVPDVKSEGYEFDCGEGLHVTGWNPVEVDISAFVDAISSEGAKLTVDISSNSWGNITLQVGEAYTSINVLDLGWQTKGKLTVTSDEILKAINKELPDATFADIKTVVFNAGDCTVKSFVVTVPAPSAKKKVNNNLAYVYVTDEYHGVLLGGRFLAMPHTDIGGYCPMCHAFIETEEAGDKSVFVLETTGGQDYDGNQATVADGVVLVDAENNGNARIATNWVAGGEAWNSIVKAIPTEGAWLKVTYTGKLNSIIFQTDKTSAPDAFETTVPAVVEEGEQNVAWFNCADIVANSPVALSGDFGGWANFMLNFEGDTTVYGFEIVVPEVVPVAE